MTRTRTTEATESRAVSDHRSDSVETWEDALGEAEHYLGVLDSLLFLIGSSPDHDSTAKGYVQTREIGGHWEHVLTERLGWDTLDYARRVALEGWWDMQAVARKVPWQENDAAGDMIFRVEKLLAITRAALDMKPYDDPDPLPTDVTIGLYALVHEELGRVRALRRVETVSTAPDSPEGH